MGSRSKDPTSQITTAIRALIKSTVGLVFLKTAFLIVVFFLGGSLQAHAQLSCSDLPDLVGVYLRKHVVFTSTTPEIHARSADTFLRRRDPQRSLIDKSEAESLRQRLESGFKNLFRGNCAQLLATHNDFISYHERGQAEVKTFLSSPDYQIDRNASLVLDPKERERPEDTDSRQRLLETLTHFQVSNFLADGQSLEDAKRRVIHRYELRTRRLRDLDESQLLSSLLNAFSSSLDPHSSYLSSDDLEDFRIGMQLSLEGIGVSLSERDGYAVVEQVIPGGAADRLKILKPQDKIIAVAEENAVPVDVIDMTLRDIVRLIRGKKGSTVTLTVLRKVDETKRFTISIVRDKIDLEQQAAKIRIETIHRNEMKYRMAVLELPSFYGDRDSKKRLSSRDVRGLLGSLEGKGIDGLLFDLSRNGGGLLEDAIEISGFFLEEADIVAVKDNRNRRHIFEDPDPEILFSGPMVVLVSRASASAAEILAGALRDYDRAVIVGDHRTFGKGTVQSVFPLKPGLGALRVTTALFFRPGGISTQKTGVPTHMVIPSLLDIESIGEAGQPYALPGQRIEAFAGRSFHRKKDSQTYRPITAKALGKLRNQSTSRINVSEGLQDVIERLKKRNDTASSVLLSEIQEEQKADAAETSDQEPEELSPESAEDALTAQAEEALNILADLVDLQR